ncbi:hypothetical protein J9305_12670 [Leptospira interrogans]|uniref:Uncharacterized protein n=2 Tax=Leptospira interrogans serovar Pyrogenes TaxID=280500 RepID=M6ZM29_LEPIR|nr:MULTISPECIES: hypothetical protein [Leptospira]EMN30368.1 hypothetical protein LEP1GSC083_2618 [Leptospira interrogans serovar Pyrogenes str. L0374]EMP07146.1 hypothetical protein LEP1GSC124_5348 [Leptospira interrogans serovar Pyrogenes str. 200701872]EJP04926.1 hypothetical protein LEP1GSC007_2869 [Leptospira interrogans serovar Bulgarica str. Mallika]EKO04678.1 hypothetical protein LEP1GSC077_3805 [Leptospira interrogans str. C10069]EMN61313.1 hypothetical protein LEP1GSC092_3515 [Leptos
MTQQQRNDYIAEKILGAKKKILYHTWLYVKGKEFHPPFEWEFSKGETFNSRTDFESLPEWVGPICGVVFPLLAQKNWCISFLHNGHVSLRDSEDWAILNIRTGSLATILIDAHIKISEE